MFKYKFLILIYSSLILFLTNKCTLIGVGIGSLADANSNNEHYTINEELFSITPSTEISIITIAGDTMHGNYQSTTNEYSQDYKNEYNSNYNDIQKQLVVPRINDTLIISIHNGKIYKYVFLGFDYNAICVKSTLSKKEDFIKLNSDFKFKLPNGQYLDQHRIKNAFEFKSIPIMSKINIINNKETYSIFYHRMQKIQTKSANNAAFIILAGITIDLLIFKNSDFPFKPSGW